MDTQIAWSNKSILNIKTDQPYNQSGQVSISGSTLLLGQDSSISYLYTYGQEASLLKTNKLRALISVSAQDTSILSRNSDNIQVVLTIQYYKEKQNSEGEVEGFEDGHFDSIVVSPYFIHEHSGNTGYMDEFISNIDNLYIKSLLITFKNKTNTYLNFQLPRIYPSLGLEDAIKESGITGSAAQIESIGIYNDGIVVRYKDEELPAFIKKQNLADGIQNWNISDVYTFGVVVHTGNMPYGRLEQ